MQIALEIPKPIVRSRKPKASIEKIGENVRQMIGRKVTSFIHRKRIFNSFMCVLSKMMSDYGYKPKKIEMQSPIAGSLVVVTHFTDIKFTWHYYW